MVTDSAQPPALYLAVDIGGTKVEAAVVDERGAILTGSRTRAATGPDADPARLRIALTEVVTAARSLVPADRALDGVGIGSAGPIDHVAETISPLNMPRLAGFALHDAMSAVLGDDLPIAIGLDGLCIALAEWRWGAARGCSNVLSMVVSTGIGAGVIVDGRPLVGADGNAGHIGQLRMTRDGDTDPTTGTLEALASGPATVTWARSQGWHGERGEDLVRSALDGHPTALAAITRSAEAVGEALAGASALTGVDTVIIGGGFALNAPGYLDIVQQRAHDVAILPSAHALRVLRPELGSVAPLVGAAQLVAGKQRASGESVVSER